MGEWPAATQSSSNAPEPFSVLDQEDKIGAIVFVKQLGALLAVAIDEIALEEACFALDDGPAGRQDHFAGTLRIFVFFSSAAETKCLLDHFPTRTRSELGQPNGLGAGDGLGIDNGLGHFRHFLWMGLSP